MYGTSVTTRFPDEAPINEKAFLDAACAFSYTDRSKLIRAAVVEHMMVHYLADRFNALQSEFNEFIQLIPKGSEALLARYEKVIREELLSNKYGSTTPEIPSSTNTKQNIVVREKPSLRVCNAE